MSHMNKFNEEELLDLGKKLQQFYESGYINKKQTIIFSFLKGMASGFGAVIGGTLVLALVLWILSLFGQIPLIGHFMDTLNQTIQAK